MLITKIDHITINAKDLSASLYFYNEVLQLPKAGTVDMGNHILTYLELPDNCKLELITYDDSNSEINYQGTERGIYRHIAFQINNINQLCEIFKENNVKITQFPTYIELLKSVRMLVADPNGVELEFIENGSGGKANA